jgi:hypothetical protein
MALDAQLAPTYLATEDLRRSRGVVQDSVRSWCRAADPGREFNPVPRMKKEAPS